MSNKQPLRPGGGNRYAAKLLFQYRVERNGTSNKKRHCEIRIINFISTVPRAALEYAKSYGEANQVEYTNNSGDVVRIEFVGVMDMLQLSSTEEVWFDIGTLLTPMEQKDKWIPADSEHINRLSAHQCTTRASSATWRLDATLVRRCRKRLRGGR